MIKNTCGALLLLAAAAAFGCAAQRDAHDELQGVIELHQRVLGFELAGRLRSRSVERGQRVEVGQELAQLDDGLLIPQRDARRAELAAAQAQLKLLEQGARSHDLRALAAEVDAARAQETTLREAAVRARELRAQGSIPAQQLDDAEGGLARAQAQRHAADQRLLSLRAGARPAELRAAQAKVDAAQAALELELARLQRTKLLAPVAGVILETHAEVGEVLGAAAPIVTLAEVQRPYIDLFVPEADVRGLRVGATARVHTDAEGARQFEGRVEEIGSRTEFAPRYLFSPKERPNLVVRVRLALQDPEGRLRAGLPAFGSIDRDAPAAAGSSERGALPPAGSRDRGAAGEVRP